MFSYNEKRKTVDLGTYKFDLVITREMSVDAIKSHPRYWELANTNLSKKILNDSLDLDKLTAEEEIEILATKSELEAVSEEIVYDTLPEMLKKANNDLGDFESYKEYAEKIIEFCKDNECLYDFIDSEEQSKGFISLTMEFILSGFTQGRTSSKPKIKIMMS